MQLAGIRRKALNVSDADAPFNAGKNLLVTQKLFDLADFQLCAKSEAGESFHPTVIHIMAR